MKLQRGIPVHTPIDPSQKKRNAEFVSQFSVSSEEFDQFEKSDEIEKQNQQLNNKIWIVYLKLNFVKFQPI